MDLLRPGVLEHRLGARRLIPIACVHRNQVTAGPHLLQQRLRLRGAVARLDQGADVAEEILTGNLCASNAALM